MIGQGIASFTESWAGGRRLSVRYHRLGSRDGIEPLVHVRQFHGIKPAYVELSEEFRLFHNLYDAGDGRLIKVDDDGSEQVAAELSNEGVRVDTRLLRQYQAARQLDLVLYIDSRHQSKASSPAPAVKNEDTVTDLIHTSFHIGDLHGQPFSRFFGKRIVPAPRRRDSGVWPYERRERYPKFIIDLDARGRDVEYACDPDKLANYFGANPQAPHYLTPVHFNRAVLQKYYEHPEKYSVRDGYLACGTLWGMRLDNDSPDVISAHLGDLGRDLPERERDHWKSHNIRPSGPMSETAVRRAFYAEFSEPQALDLVFRREYEDFAEAWRIKHGWELFRTPNPGDEHILQRVRVPLTDAQPEFEGQLVNLARLLVDALNDAELAKRVPGLIGGEKSIAKFEAWLRSHAYTNTARDTKLLRDLQELRSSGAAHMKGRSYVKRLSQVAGSSTDAGVIEHFLSGAVLLLRDMTAHFRARAT